MNDTTQAVIKASVEDIIRKLDSFLLGAYNIYSVGKVLPHPYDAVGDMGSAFLHDFKNFAFQVENYVKRVNGELEKEES